MNDQKQMLGVYDRNQLVHAVIWPKAKGAVVSLLDTDGVEQSVYPVRAPRKGSELSKMIPEGYYLHVQNCCVVNMSGKIVVATKAPFDTAVVTERAELTVEQRMQRLEIREARNERRQKQLLIQNEEMARQLAERQPVDDPVIVEPPAEPPAEPPQDAPQAQPDQATQEGSQDA